MALHISEYNALTALNLPAEPAASTQVVEIGDQSAASKPFIAGVKVVRLHADAPCAFKFGKDPVASEDDTRMAAGATEYFAVEWGYKVAVIGLTSVGSSDSLSGLLQMISDPKAAKARLEEVTAKTDAYLKAAAQAKALAASLERTKAALAASQRDLEQRTQALEAARVEAAKQAEAALQRAAALDVRTQAHDDAMKGFNAERAKSQMALNGERAAFEKAALKQTKDLEAREHAVAALEKNVAAREAALKEGEDNLAQRMRRLKELAA